MTYLEAFTEYRHDYLTSLGKWEACTYTSTVPLLHFITDAQGKGLSVPVTKTMVGGAEHHRYCINTIEDQHSTQREGIAHCCGRPESICQQYSTIAEVYSMVVDLVAFKLKVKTTAARHHVSEAISDPHNMECLSWRQAGCIHKTR